MIWPPSVLRLVIKKESRNISIWLPLFMMWPFLVLAAIVLAPVVLALGIVLWWTGWGRPMLRSVPAFFEIFCALRGLQIDIRKPYAYVHISIR